MGIFQEIIPTKALGLGHQACNFCGFSTCVEARGVKHLLVRSPQRLASRRRAGDQVVVSDPALHQDHRPDLHQALRPDLHQDHRQAHIGEEISLALGQAHIGEEIALTAHIADEIALMALNQAHIGEEIALTSLDQAHIGEEIALTALDQARIGEETAPTVTLW